MIWNIKKGAWELRMFFSVYNGYRRRHNRVIREIGVLEELTLEEINDYYNYWKVINSKISLKTVRISKTLSGKYNKYIVPEEFYTLYFEPYFNSDKSVGFLQNKSIYNKWFQGKYFPKDYFHKIDGVYYTESFEVIEDIYYFIDNNRPLAKVINQARN
ncbi:hypothetical protein [Psychrobacter maritimus]|uniref:hypothetical protein n=1 Tax=Psychrobacter maritimus TaxID=256325 RepID=UPI001919DBF0|nr:hypothetical protein [Psychrobacter maritimus]